MLWLALIGCGGIPATKNTTKCSIAVDGPVVGDVTCNAEDLSYESVANTSTFTLGGGAVGTTSATTENAPLVWSGMPTPSTYSPPSVVSANGSLSGSVGGKMHTWIARYQMSPPMNEPNTGSYTLTLSSTSTIISAGGSTQYFAHGSADLTLVDQDPTAPQPDIHVTASF